MRLDKTKERFKDRDLVILTCYQTQHSAHPKHCSASPGALWDGHLLLHPTVDERRALSLNPEGSLLPLTLLFLTAEATLSKQVNYHHWPLSARCSPPLPAAVAEALKSSTDIRLNSSKWFPQAPIPFLVFAKLRKKSECKLPVASRVSRLRIIKHCPLPWAHGSFHSSASRRRGFSDLILLIFTCAFHAWSGKMLFHLTQPLLSQDWTPAICKSIHNIELLCTYPFWKA